MHQGSSCHCGHYYSYVKGTNNIWYIANDSSVILFKTLKYLKVYKVSKERVFSDQPYILFYRKIQSFDVNAHYFEIN